MEYTSYLGIDVSKKTLDMVDEKDNHKIVTNDLVGFNELVKFIPEGALCVMEATGIYHLELATYLHSKKVNVAVVNPLRIKRFSQMKMNRSKTDKVDAKMICQYAQEQDIKLFEPLDPNLAESKDVYRTMEQFINTRASFKNKLAELKATKAVDYLIQSIEDQITMMSAAIKKLENKIKVLVTESHATLLSNLKSIAGIGERTATLLIISSDGFQHFDSAKQLASYYGLAPMERKSGTSLNAKSSISKMGNPLVRKKMYMCSLQASKRNTSCANLYQRLLAKGKPKKLALIAVANKLLRIAYAIAKSGLPYDSEYKSYPKLA